MIYHLKIFSFEKAEVNLQPVLEIIIQNFQSGFYDLRL